MASTNDVSDLPGEGKLNPFSIIACPYDPGHRVTAKRFHFHLRRCRKYYANKGFELKTCPFNASHDLDESSYDRHLITCPDRVLIDDDLVLRLDDDDDGVGIVFAEGREHGDVTSPPLKDSVRESQKHAEEDFDLESWATPPPSFTARASEFPSHSAEDPCVLFARNRARAIRENPSLEALPKIGRALERVKKAEMMETIAANARKMGKEERRRARRERKKKERKGEEETEAERKRRKEKRRARRERRARKEEMGEEEAKTEKRKRSSDDRASSGTRISNAVSLRPFEMDNLQNSPYLCMAFRLGLLNLGPKDMKGK